MTWSGRPFAAVLALAPGLAAADAHGCPGAEAAERIVGAIEAVYAGLESRNAAAVADAFAPEADGTVPVQAFPFAPDGITRCAEGAGAIREGLGGLLEGTVSVSFAGRRITPICAPGRAVVETEGTIRYEDGTTYRNRFVVTAEVDVASGKILRFTEHYDPAAVERAYGPLPPEPVHPAGPPPRCGGG